MQNTETACAVYTCTRTETEQIVLCRFAKRKKDSNFIEQATKIHRKSKKKSVKKGTTIRGRETVQE